jgi:hypothetical protein
MNFVYKKAEKEEKVSSLFQWRYRQAGYEWRQQHVVNIFVNVSTNKKNTLKKSNIEHVCTESGGVQCGT